MYAGRQFCPVTQSGQRRINWSGRAGRIPRRAVRHRRAAWKQKIKRSLKKRNLKAKMKGRFTRFGPVQYEVGGAGNLGRWFWLVLRGTFHCLVTSGAKAWGRKKHGRVHMSPPYLLNTGGSFFMPKKSAFRLRSGAAFCLFPSEEDQAHRGAEKLRI